MNMSALYHILFFGVASQSLDDISQQVTDAVCSSTAEAKSSQQINDEVSLAQLRLGINRRQARAACEDFGGVLPNQRILFDRHGAPLKNPQGGDRRDKCDALLNQFVEREENFSPPLMDLIGAVHDIDELANHPPWRAFFTLVGTIAANSRVMSLDLRKVVCAGGADQITDFAAAFLETFHIVREPLQQFQMQIGHRQAELRALLMTHPDLQSELRSKLRARRAGADIYALIYKPLVHPLQYPSHLAELQKAIEGGECGPTLVPDELPKAEQEIVAATQMTDELKGQYPLIELQDMFPQEDVFSLGSPEIVYGSSRSTQDVEVENVGYGILASAWEPKRFLLTKDVLFVWSSDNPEEHGLVKVPVSDMDGIGLADVDGEAVHNIMLKAGLECPIATHIDGIPSIPFKGREVTTAATATSAAAAASSAAAAADVGQLPGQLPQTPAEATAQRLATTAQKLATRATVTAGKSGSMWATKIALAIRMAQAQEQVTEDE